MDRSHGYFRLEDQNAAKIRQRKHEASLNVSNKKCQCASVSVCVCVHVCMCVCERVIAFQFCKCCACQCAYSEGLSQMIGNGIRLI